MNNLVVKLHVWLQEATQAQLHTPEHSGDPDLTYLVAGVHNLLNRTGMRPEDFLSEEDFPECTDNCLAWECNGVCAIFCPLKFVD